jgi:type I restriction enzyme S subunit
VSVPHISPDQVNNFVIPVPPIDEQQAIVEQVSNLATLYSGLINEAVLSIELLQERRSALISAAVTGQIDVRSLEPAHAP